MPRRPRISHPPRRAPLPDAGPAQVGKAPIAPGSTPPARGRGLSLPHERDESTGSVDAAPPEVIKQAKRDIDAGLVDTDMRASAGLDAARRRRLVPGPGGRGHG